MASKQSRRSTARETNQVRVQGNSLRADLTCLLAAAALWQAAPGQELVLNPLQGGDLGYEADTHAEANGREEVSPVGGVRLANLHKAHNNVFKKHENTKPQTKKTCAVCFSNCVQSNRETRPACCGTSCVIGLTLEDESVA